MSHNHFANPDIASRYDRHRPPVHGIIEDWLREAGLAGPYRRAVDIACGTGHSTLPLLRLADTVEGIDASPQMAEQARRKGLDVQVGDLASLASAQYDLLSICMAFHWFDRAEALREMRRASQPGATWLIYNFWLAGHRADPAFNHWLRDSYPRQFPAPQRAVPHFQPQAEETGIQLMRQGQGSLPVTFSRRQLIAYLTTQSNIEAALSDTFGYADAETLLDASLPAISNPDGFEYGYRYSICRLV
ncbi:class I SAM-dependent methyltransferase [Chromobacterium paludis]|uniref:Class I SAM-dependent methyltransferase n=1 Tax=Chromobacterium paludis TaxID=2605945 RepID=A0A5C1DI16_9NEIS|nr:class I SAM-dependent methyltransferase [Chromobacterium paludis]QEL55657.1 class I SAM-dependent methyltransferase [Chromobacterium paludis]